MQSRVVARVILLMSVAGMMAGALAADTYTPPTSDAFLNGIKSYPFAANAKRREKIRVGVPQLTRCMLTTEVRSRVGDPDFGYVAYKGGVPSKKGWTYVLEKKALKEVEPSSRVVIFFGTDDKLIGVTVHGAPDIESNVSRREQICP